MEHLKLFALILLIFAASCAKGQNLWLSVEVQDSVAAGIEGQLNELEGNFADSLSLYEQIGNVRNLLYSQGHLLSEAELVIGDSTARLEIFAGPTIYKSKLRLHYPEDFAIPRPSERKKPDEVLSPEVLEEIIQHHLSFLENNGYPFARLHMADYFFQGDTLKGDLAILPGPETTIDSIIVKGYDRVSRNVLRYNLELREGMLYNESLLQDLPGRTQQIEYLNMTRSPAVAFTKSKTLLYLYFEEVQGNTVDGVVGLNTEENGDVTLTGDFQLRLLNVLNRGEEMQLRWRRPGEEVQALDLFTEVPFLFRTPLWMEVQLNIFRQDSSFVNTSFEGLLKYLIESGSFVSGGVTYRSSNVLLDEDETAATGDFNSFNTTLYKLGLQLRRTNRAIAPTAGFNFIGYGMTGTRQTGDESQEQHGWEVVASQFVPLGRSHVIKLGLQSQALFGNQLFRNELFRIGGLRTLRGFNEQSIYSSAYGIGTLEYRYMIGEFDYLTAFADLAYSETETVNEAVYNLFTGIGAGINFRTGAGIFSLFYAVGRDNENPFDFGAAKVHFGYINRF